MHKSEASHPGVHEHQRPPIYAEEAGGFHKRVKMIHDPVKIVVPCAVFEVEFPIPPDKVDKDPAEAASIDTDQIPSNETNKPASIDATTSPSIDTRRISEHKEFDVCENLRDGNTTTRSDKSGGKKRMNWKKRKWIKGDSQLSLIARFSDGISIDTLVETSTDYSIGILIDALGQALMHRLNMLTKVARSTLAYSSKS
ncbi:hypothetical protein DY000_02059892 [Brassica cretica]|uniref:Uncharacterized protein n=1 Tax=Brassica cretica TaxID=69181 RepID=A0ABQ7APU6_BRACR|nr:hypothetical protein DY000_02059892 [Brassica cretica]